MSSAPAFASTPLLGAALVSNSTADTSFGTPAHATEIVAAGANGSKISRIDLIPTGTISTGGVVVNLYLYDGTGYHLHESVLIAAITPGTQAASQKYSYTYDDLVLEAGWSLYATETVVSQPVQVNAYGGSF